MWYFVLYLFPVDFTFLMGHQSIKYIPLKPNLTYLCDAHGLCMSTGTNSLESLPSISLTEPLSLRSHFTAASRSYTRTWGSVMLTSCRGWATLWVEEVSCLCALDTESTHYCSCTGQRECTVAWGVRGTTAGKRQHLRGVGSGMDGWRGKTTRHCNIIN